MMLPLYLRLAHPLCVHFSICLWTFASLLALSKRLVTAKLSEAWQWAGDICLWLGTGLSFFTVLSGFLAWRVLLQHGSIIKASHEVLFYHRTCALITFSLYVIAAVIRAQQCVLKRKPSWLVGLLLLAGFIVLVLTGYFGGLLVYHYQI